MKYSEVLEKLQSDYSEWVPKDSVFVALDMLKYAHESDSLDFNSNYEWLRNWFSDYKPFKD